MPSTKWLSVLFVSFVAMPLAAASAEGVDFLGPLLRSKPRGYIEQHADAFKVKPDNPREAFQWRLRTMLDEHGRIPPGAFHRANVHRRNAGKGRGRNDSRFSVTTQAESINPFSWISRGPQNVGGRTLALLVHPTNTQVLYAGAASGGIWKSTNGGQTWTPLDDFMANLHIGALAFDPNNPNVIYAGTGERAYDRVVRNSGVFKSTNGGATWLQLVTTANWLDVQTIAPQPGSSSVLLAATGGGIFRSTDAGTTWALAAAPNLDQALGVAFDPSNGNRAVAAVMRNDNTVRPYYSQDGGVTFTPAANASGTFAAEGGDMAVAYAPSDPSIVYALVRHNRDGRLWRSTDGGVTYTQRNHSGSAACDYRRCTLWISPADTNLVVAGGVHLFRSADGGNNFTLISRGDILTNDPHVDQHCIVADPQYDGTNNRRVYFCTDGGVWRAGDILAAAPNHATWTPLTATYQTTQFYSAAAHDLGAGAFFGGTQDNGTLLTTKLTNTAELLLDGDGSFVDIDPTNVGTWYMQQQSLRVHRMTNGGAAVPIFLGISGTRYFIAPIRLDPNTPTTLYAGASSLWRTTNATAESVAWSNIGPELATGEEPISAIEVTPGNSNVVYVGRGTGQLLKTTNATSAAPAWTELDNNAAANPLPNRYITRIYAVPSTPNVVYVALGGFAYDNLWVSYTGGNSFFSASGSGIYSLPPAPIRAIVSHPQDAWRLYAGTDVGVFESEDGGSSWYPVAAGPADVMIDELRFVLGTNTLLAATHGRGLWTVDVTLLTAPPTNLTALASGTGPVNLTWTGVDGATGYEILRGVDGAAPTPYATSGTTSYSDANVLAGKSYLYTVRALSSGGSSPESNLDFATTVAFTHDNQLQGKTVLAAHLVEIRTAVNALRRSAGLAELTFTNPAIPGSPILAIDITAVRTGLAEAYDALDLPPPSFTDTITASSTPVKAVHWQEIRNAVK